MCWMYLLVLNFRFDPIIYKRLDGSILSFSPNGTGTPEFDALLDNDTDSGSAVSKPEVELEVHPEGEVVPDAGTSKPEGSSETSPTSSAASLDVKNNHDNAVANKVVIYNVQNFPYVVIHFYGLGNIIIDFAVAISGLSRTCRKKLAQLINKQKVSAGEISAIAPQPIDLDSNTKNKAENGTSAPVQENDAPSVPGVNNAENTANDSKKLTIMLTALGLPINTSLSKLKWVFSPRTITPEIKASIATSLGSYSNKNSPKGKRKAE